MSQLEVRPLAAADAEPIAAAFAAVRWPGKDVAQYRRYADEQAAGFRSVPVAWFEGRFAGYLTVVWRPKYAPFRAAGVPEIQDLNVLPQLRRRGIGSALMDAAEELIAARCDTAGIGVGLYADAVVVDDHLALMMTRRLRT